MEQEEQYFTDNSKDFGINDNEQSQQEQMRQQEDKNADVQKPGKKKKSQIVSNNEQSQQEQNKQQEDKNADVQKPGKKKKKSQNVRNKAKDETLQTEKESDYMESQPEQTKQQDDKNEDEQSQKSAKKKNKQRDRNKAKVETLQKEIESLEAQLEAATKNKPEQTLCDCITSSPSLREQVETLNAELKNVRKDKEILSRKKRTAKEKKNLLRDEINKLKRETDQLNNEISEWKNSVCLLKNDNKNNSFELATGEGKDEYMQNVTEKEQEIRNFQEAYKIEKGQFEKVIKEKDKKIQDLNAEKKYIASECTQKDKKIGQLENRLKALKQMNSKLQNIRDNQSETITTLGQEKKALQEEKKSLVLRLSKLAGANLTYQNPDIADLSDEKRPTKLAEEFSELYDNEWTDAFEHVDIEDEKDKTTFMLQLLKRANELCNEVAENHIQTIKKSFSTITVKSKVHPKHTPEGHLDDKLPVATQPKPGTSSKTEREEAEDPRAEADTDVNIPKNDYKNVKGDGDRITTVLQIFQNDTKYMEADTDNITVLNDHTLTDNMGNGNGELHGPALVQNTKSDVTQSSSCEVDMDGTAPENETRNMETDSAYSTELIEDQESPNTSEDRESAKGQGYQIVENPVKDSELDIQSQLPPEEFGTTVNNFEMGTQNQFAAQQSHDRNEDEEPKQKKMKLESDYELLSKEQKKTILEARKLFEKELSGKVEKAGTDFIVQELGIDVQNQGTVAAYIQKCINICWSMCRLEPPVHVEFATVDDDTRFDTNKYKPYTKSGSHLDYLVWPAVHLHKDGPMLAKGVAQGRKK